jgi:LytR cell envelope-related transcriptional attenuator
VDAPLPVHELVRPWRRATLVASLVAAVELVLLAGAGAMLLAKPLSRVVRHHAEAQAFAPVTKTSAALSQTIAVGLPRLAREETGVYILNGNGRAGAAAAASEKLRGLGYVVPGTGNARHQNYATSVVMYRAGYRPEAARLARDLHIKVVGPLDGMAPGALMGGQLAVILGAG